MLVINLIIQLPKTFIICITKIIFCLLHFRVFYIKSLAKLQLYFKVLHKNVVIKIATAVFIEIQLKIIKIFNNNKLLKTIKLPLV